MNLRVFIWCSAALNVALVAGVWLTLGARSLSVGVSVAPAVVPARVEAAFATADDSPARPASIPAAQLRWNQIASDDLKVYRDNLRAIGCPSLTVRDIILAEINGRFADRRRALLAGFQTRFWELAIHGEAALRNEWGPPMDALSAERQRMIEDVLGYTFGVADSARQASRDEEQNYLSWLPVDKREALFALEEKYHRNLQLLDKAIADRANGQPTDADTVRRQELEKEFAEAKAALLTPQELEELGLRASRDSLWAIDVSGFEVSEEEWRTITRLRVNFGEADQNLQGFGLSHEDQLKRHEQLEADLIRATKAALGPERYATFERASDGQFQEVYRVTQRYGLPDSIAVQAFQQQQAAEAKAARMREDKELAGPARAAALTALRQETERTLAKTLGDKVFATYREYGGSWLDELSGPN